MKTINFFLCLSLLACGTSYAQNAENAHLPKDKGQEWKHWKKEHYNQKFEGNHETIKANSLILIKDCTVAQEVCVHGKVRIENSEMATLMAKGHITLIDSDISNGAQTNGFLLANNCSISGGLSVGSDKISLINTSVDSISFRSKSEKTQKLFLMQGTQVTGTITFANGKGEVHITDDVQLGGNVEGGVVIRPNQETSQK